MIPPMPLTPFRLELDGKNYLIKPRLEPIAMDKSGAVHCFAYELLCTVYGPERQDPHRFFATLSQGDVLRIYNQSLQQLPVQGVHHLTLNISSTLLLSPALYQLLAMFPNIVYYLELSENSPGLQQIMLAQQLIQSVEGLRAYIWLDDFGSSFANFDSLLHHSFDGIKLAKEVFWGLYDHDRDLLTKILQFLKKNSPLVVVEGVDSPERYDFVITNNCAAQGYFLNSL
ncbi:MAG: EAL domain-containing protein [Alkalimonas sp.]|nr:EAL domain-containing protein [Alkalimonas sp.]